MPKFRAGDVVTIIKPGHYGSWKPDNEGVLVIEGQNLSCPLCRDKDCYEWANILTTKGEWLYHVSECCLDLSEFGKELAAEVTKAERRQCHSERRKR